MITAILTPADYEAAMARIEALMDAELDTPEGKELSALSDLVVAYEAVHYPIEPMPEISAQIEECERLRKLAHDAPRNSESYAWADRSREWSAACAKLEAMRRAP